MLPEFQIWRMGGKKSKLIEETSYENYKQKYTTMKRSGKKSLKIPNRNVSGMWQIRHS